MPIIKNRDATDKQERRSPIKQSPLRLPGQALREEIFKLTFDEWLSPLMTAVFLGMLAIIEWIRWIFRLPPTRGSCFIVTGIALVGTVLAIRQMRAISGRMKNLRQGLDGEMAVGQFLEEYCRERKYKVLHDLKGDGFNVDHILVGPGGIFAIETKTISKPRIGVPVVTYDGDSVLVDGMRPDRDPVAQVKACARHVAEVLAGSTNRDAKGIFVRPVVLYPGWFVEGSSAGTDAWVLEPKAFVQFLHHENERLSPEDIGLFHSRLKLENRAARDKSTR
jgi:hypothetical protein